LLLFFKKEGFPWYGTLPAHGGAWGGLEKGRKRVT
jgi:hypothetical protein